MINRKRLEELIEQEATIYELYIKDILQVKLEKNYFIVNDSLYKSTYAFRTWCLKDLYETREDAEFVKEFGCIEWVKRLNLPTWEEYLQQSNKVIHITGCNGCYIELNFQGNYLTIYDFDCDYEYYKDIATKENYIEACRVLKSLFIGEF